MRGVVLVNPAAGGSRRTRSELARWFADHQVIECHPDEMADRAEEAVRDGAQFVAVAGGDGSIRCVADVLVRERVPLLPIPTGTRNHFARELGVDSLEAAAAAVRGDVLEIDVGEVNGDRFVNNCSLGVYPQVVLARRSRSGRWSKNVANLVGVWQQVRRGHRFQVRLEGRWYRVWMVFVGNGRYGAAPATLTRREALDENVLDLRLVRADSPLARTRVVLALLSSRLHRSPLLVIRRCREVELELDREYVEVALDGEVKRLAPPLRYRSVPVALRVLVPPSPSGGVGQNGKPA